MRWLPHHLLFNQRLCSPPFTIIPIPPSINLLDTATSRLLFIRELPHLGRSPPHAPPPPRHRGLLCSLSDRAVRPAVTPPLRRSLHRRPSLLNTLLPPLLTDMPGRHPLHRTSTDSDTCSSSRSSPTQPHRTHSTALLTTTTNHTNTSTTIATLALVHHTPTPACTPHLPPTHPAKATT